MSGPRLLDRYYDALSRSVAGSAWATSIPLFRLAYALPSTKLRPPKLDMYLDDPLLGWKLKPHADVVHPLFESRPRYTTDEAGCRRTRARKGRSLHMLGCSWTFGYGVDDADCFPAVVGRKLSVVNWGCPGWGAQQQFALMRDRLLPSAAGTRGIVYFWMPWHLERAWRGRRWLQHMAGAASTGPRKNPLFEPERGSLVFRGLIGVDEAVDDERLVAQMEWRVTTDLVVAMRDAARAAGVPFLVALLPLFRAHELYADSWEAETARFEGLLRKRGVPFVNLASGPAPRIDASRFLFRFHPHPSPLGHEVIAQTILDRALPHLGGE